MRPVQLTVLARVYGSWKYDLITIAAAILYYWIFEYLIEASSRGIILLSIPAYLIYILVITAAISITLGIFSLSHALRQRKILAGTSSSTVSTFSVLAAGISVGCACQAPILYNLLYFLGLNTLEASSIVVGINDYQVQIISLLIILNVLMIVVVTWRMPLAYFANTKKPR
jgi:hypothetical protein